MPGQVGLPGQHSHQPGSNRTKGTTVLKDSGRFPIPVRAKMQLNPPSNHIVLLSTSQKGKDFISALSDPVNQSRSTEYALNSCPSATGRTNNTDPHKTSALHSTIQPLAGICIPPETCNKKGSDEAGTHMADEGRNPKRGGWMFGWRSHLSTISTALANTAWHGSSCISVGG